MSTKRIEIIKELGNLLDQAHEDIVLKYGYVDWKTTYGFPFDKKFKFFESDVDVNRDNDKREMVLVKYSSQEDMFGIQQSIEGDGVIYIIDDVMKAVHRL